MKDTLAMMRAFFSDLWRNRQEVKKQDRWRRRYAEQRGYRVNPRWMIYTNLKLWLIDSEHLFGKPRDPLRGLQVPDALHQVKRALGVAGPSSVRIGGTMWPCDLRVRLRRGGVSRRRRDR